MLKLARIINFPPSRVNTAPGLEAHKKEALPGKRFGRNSPKLLGHHFNDDFSTIIAEETQFHREFAYFADGAAVQQYFGTGQG